MMNKAPMTAYSIATHGLEDAEINLYGEVVQKRPVDWDGVPIDGNYIVVDDFIRDLDSLKDMQRITLHINSVGGDLYGGVSIYNRLKELDAEITTINDGLAASAASIIYQAGDVRKMNSGSNLMVHQASGFLFGYYNNADLTQVSKQLEAANKAAINIYVEASGRSEREMKKLVNDETWMTGKEAVDAGLADEVIDAETPISMSLSADKMQMIVNGVALSTRGMHNIPAGVPVMKANKVVSNAGTPAVDKNNTEGGKVMDNEKMEIKNLDELKAAYPELIEQITNAAKAEGKAEGIKAERARIQGIEEIENAVADKELVKGAKYGEATMTAEQLAFKAMQMQAATGAKMLADMKADSAASGVDEVGATPNDGPETKEPEIDAAKEIADTVNLFKQIKGGK